MSERRRPGAAGATPHPRRPDGPAERKRLRPGAVEEGDIVHVDGRVLGRHGGIINYTIGQRKGLGIAAQEPLYVIKLDAARREVVVGPRDALKTRTMALRDVNWLGDEAFETIGRDGTEVMARIRSTGPLQPAVLRIENGCVMVDLAHGEDGVSPGQACVFYAATGGGERLLGGGWIKSATRGAWLAKDGFAGSASYGPAETVAAGSR